MTPPELAALAAKVPGFKRPTCDCDRCDEGTITDQFGDGARACRACKGTGTVADNSPAALLMAVADAAHKLTVEELKVRVERYCPKIEGFYEAVVAIDMSAPTHEARARAALVALLRAHGVDCR